MEALEALEALGGNTNIPKDTPKARGKYSKKWVFTLNNYTVEELEALEAIFEGLAEKYVIGKEIGESGTPHLQGAVIFKKATRPIEACKNKRIHWEQQKGNDKQAFDYCMKDNNYTGKGVPKPLKLIKPDRPYQREILNILDTEPDERAIYWFYDETGNVGKSSFSKYLVAKRGAIFISQGNCKDLENIIYNTYVKGDPIDIVVIDIPRNNGNKCSYNAIENIKSGLICNTKYETGNCIFNSPHIIIFSNEYPETNKLSKDRWHIYEISSEDYTTTKKILV